MAAVAIRSRVSRTRAWLSGHLRYSTGLLFAAFLSVIVAQVAGTFGFDAFAYWNVNGAEPYQTGVGGLGAFNYTPPIARLFDPFGALEWPTFLWIWLALLIGNVIWLGRRGVRVWWL